MDSDTQPVDPNTDDRFTGTVNTSWLTEPPVPRADTKPRPTPGLYVLRFGTVTAALKKGLSGVSTKTGEPYAFPDEVVAIPNLTIVSDAAGDTTFAGTPINPYFRLTSSRVERTRGVYENYSTLSSAMASVGVEMPIGEAVPEDDIIVAAEAMSGRTTQWPAYCSYAAEWKFKPFVRLGDGNFLRFSEKAFRLAPDIKASTAAAYQAAGGTWARLGWLLNPDDDATRNWTLTQPSEDAAQKRIFANFQPTSAGFQPGR